MTNTYVLLHGAWRGAWAWGSVPDFLSEAGHRVIAPTLPGLNVGDDPNDAHLESVIEAVTAILSAERPESTIVVAQDWSSFPATAAVNRINARLKHLVHWCGFIPREGKSFLDTIPVPDARMLLERAQLNGGAAVKVPWKRWRENFLHTASDDTARLTYDLLRPHPLNLFTEALPAGEAQLPEVQTTYLISELDRSLEPGPEWWDTGQAIRLDQEPIRLPFDFSPTFTHPREFAEALLALSS
ncbi:alpha/beta hydrolase [Arthrobacter sp. D2-10]